MEGLQSQQVADQGNKFSSSLARFMTKYYELSPEWEKFLREVLADRQKVERALAIAAELSRGGDRDPLDVLVEDHLRASESYLSRVLMSDLYPFYLELCRTSSGPVKSRVEVEARISQAFPNAVRRMAPLPAGVHFSFLSLVSGNGGNHA